ncbi:MAG: hypothetical protein DRI86_04075 [Bacteroidetes bacterium]|nr:MAG: hypothetical protein DRI86_04075 [Bacteroidota bacterium]
MKNFKLFFLLSVLILGSSITSQAQLKLLSGLENGTYEALSKDMMKVSSQEMVVLNSNGSVDNFNQLVDNNNDIFVAFIQYDVLLHNEENSPELRKNLRVLFPLFLDEEVHIITTKGSKIINIEDLKGKKVAVGTPEQGTFVTAATIKRMSKIEWKDVEISSNDALAALNAGEIDAYFYVGGAPVKSLSEISKDSKLQLVNISTNGLEEVYTTKVIKKGTYAWQKKDVHTLAVPTLIACNIHEMTLDTRRKLNTLLTDTKSNIGAFEKSGHKKWQDVYTKSLYINWPYYYLKPIVE